MRCTCASTVSGPPDNHLAEGDAVGEVASGRALPLRHGIGAVIVRWPHAFCDRLVLVNEADPRR